VLFAQQVLLHLAHGVARQFADHEAALGNLEIRQPAFQLRDHGVAVDAGARPGNDHRHAHFAEVRVRHAHQRAFGHAGQLVDVALDLGRVDVVAATDDQVLAAADDVDITALVDPADVAGLEPAVGSEFFFRLFRHAPVALEDVGALDLDGADLAAGQCLRVIAGHAHADARQRKAHGAAAPLALLRVVRVRGEHDGLAHPVALQDGLASALLPLAEGLQQQRRGAGDEQAHVLRRFAGQRRFGQHPHVQRRHAHEDGGLAHLRDHQLRVELRQPDHLAAGVQNRRQLVGRSRHHVVAVAVVRRPLQQRAGAVVIEREDMAGSGLEGDLADPAEVPAATDHHGRFGVADEVFDLGALVGGVQRQEHVAGAQRRQVQQHRLDRFLHLHRDPGALGQAQRAQQVGQHGGGALQVAPGIDRAVLGLHRRGLQVGGERGAQRGVQVVVRHQSRVAPEAFTTVDQRLTSSCTNAPNCGWLRSGKSAPLLAQMALSSGELTALRTSSATRAVTSAGVPLGAHRPYQVVTV